MVTDDPFAAAITRKLIARGILPAPPAEPVQRWSQRWIEYDKACKQDQADRAAEKLAQDVVDARAAMGLADRLRAELEAPALNSPELIRRAAGA
jgi:hypothetical protein